MTGRSDFDAYRSLATHSPNGTYLIDGSWVTGYRPSNNANPELGWEKLTSANYGIDFMFFNRLYGSIEYFDRRSQDLLYNYTAPQPPYVYPRHPRQRGHHKEHRRRAQHHRRRRGRQARHLDNRRQLPYDTTKLTKLSNSIYQASYLDLYRKPGVGTSEYFFRVEEGGKIGQFYGYEYAGVDENHNMLVYNADGRR